MNRNIHCTKRRLITGVICVLAIFLTRVGTAQVYSNPTDISKNSHVLIKKVIQTGYLLLNQELGIPGNISEESPVHGNSEKLSHEGNSGITNRADSEKDGSLRVIILIFILLVLAVFLLLINKRTSLNLKLKTSLIGLAASVTLFMIFSGGVNLYYLSNIGKEIVSIAEEDIPLTQDVTMIETHQLEQAILIEKILKENYHRSGRSNAVRMNKIEESISAFEKYSKQINKEIIEAENLCKNVLAIETDKVVLNEFRYVLNELKEIQSEHTDFEQKSEELFMAIRENNTLVLSNLEESIEVEAEHLNTALETLLINIEDFTAQSALLAEEHEKKAINVSFVIILFTVVIGLILSIVMANNISNKLGGEPEEVAEFANRIRKGDLSFDMNHNSRSGAVKDLFMMGEKLSQIIDTVRTATEMVKISSVQISEGASEQASSTEEVSSSIEEMSANIEQNKENSETTDTMSQDATKKMESGVEAVKTTVSSLKKIAEEINIIGEIAEKTDLLAINAAIEAARAGEHGKGFAVVAGEVRKLAERSQLAAREIDELSRSSVGEADNTWSIMSDLVPKFQKTSQLIREISASTIEQNAGASEINNAIQQLTVVTQQFASNAEELASQADQLNEEISFFNLGDKRSQVKTKDIGSKTTQSPELYQQKGVIVNVEDEAFEQF